MKHRQEDEEWIFDNKDFGVVLPVPIGPSHDKPVGVVVVLEQLPQHPEGLHGQLPGRADDHHARPVPDGYDRDVAMVMVVMLHVSCVMCHGPWVMGRVLAKTVRLKIKIVYRAQRILFFTYINYLKGIFAQISASVCAGAIEIFLIGTSEVWDPLPVQGGGQPSGR